MCCMRACACVCVCECLGPAQLQTLTGGRHKSELLWVQTRLSLASPACKLDVKSAEHVQPRFSSGVWGLSLCSCMRDTVILVILIFMTLSSLPAGSPSPGGDVTFYVRDINQPILPTPFNCVLVSVSVFMALSTLFHSMNSPGNCPFSLCSSSLIYALLVLSTVGLCLFMKVSFSPDLIHSG